MPKKRKKATPRANGKATPKPRKREPPTKMIIHDNSKPARRPPSPRPTRARTVPTAEETERTPLVERIQGMGGSHVVAGVSAGVITQAVGVVTVGKGWAGPKTTAGVMLGTGVATTAGGWYMDMDHVMAAGVGITTVGAVSMTNQLAADAYLAMEKRAQEKREKKAAEEAKAKHAKDLTAAQKLLDAEGGKQRNAMRIEIIEPDDMSDDDDDDDDIDDYQAAA